MLMAAQDFPPRRGGLQTYGFELARRLAPKCHRFCLVAPRTRGARALDRTLSFSMIRVGGGEDHFAWTSAYSQYRAWRSTRPDLVFCTHWASCVPWLFRSGPRVCVAAHGRELLLDPFARVQAVARGYDRLRRSVLCRAHRVLCVSHYTAEWVTALGVPADRIRIIPNGTDPERFRPGTADPWRRRLGLEHRTVLLTVGRLVPRKGVDRLIRVVARLRESFSALALVVAGEGPERHRLQRLIDELNLQSTVFLVGAVLDQELPSLYNLADIFVAPIRSEPPDVEGFGLVFLEAAASGLPVVGPDRGGPSEVIVPEVTGLTVNPDSDQALYAAIERLLANPRLRACLGSAGRRHALQRYHWDDIAERVWQTLAEVVP